MLRIRDVYPGSDFFPSRIRTVSIPDPGSASKNLSILTPKKTKKWFPSSRKYDPGCSSRIQMLTFYPSWPSVPEVKKALDPGSGSATLHLPLDYGLVSYSFLRVVGRIRIQSLIRIREDQNFRLRILRIWNTDIYVIKGWPVKRMTPYFIIVTVRYCGLT